MKKGFTPLEIRGENGNGKFLTGFTLIELLIVVIIIGILATLAMPQYQKLIEKARAMEGVQMMGHLRTGQWLYYAQHGKFYEKIGDGQTTVIDDALGIKLTEHLFDNFECEALGVKDDEGVEVWCKKKIAPFENYAFGMDEDGNILASTGGASPSSPPPTNPAGDYKYATGL